ncbi:MAG: ROK family protein [Bryobacteraceae bacterium]
MEEAVLGIDIGGTKVAAGLVNAAGEILFKTRVPMHAAGSAADAMECVHGAIRAVFDSGPKADVTAIGVASPGPLALPEGVVVESPNLPCWRNFPLGGEVRQAYGLPVVVENDASAAGLAEALWGAGAGYRNVFYATFGTGIGTALIFDRRIYRSRTRMAPEGGHMTIDMHAPVNCGCGKHGCFEGLASGTAIARRARERVFVGGARRESAFDWGTDPGLVTAKTVTEAWRAGDPIATDILRETADLTAIWLGNVIDMLEPDIVVVGGGLSGVVSEWLDYIWAQLPSMTIIPRSQRTAVEVAKYGSDSGIAGAAAVCFAELPSTDTRPVRICKLSD